MQWDFVAAQLARLVVFQQEPLERPGCCCCVSQLVGINLVSCLRHRRPRLRSFNLCHNTVQGRQVDVRVPSERGPHWRLPEGFVRLPADARLATATGTKHKQDCWSLVLALRDDAADDSFDNEDKSECKDKSSLIPCPDINSKSVSKKQIRKKKRGQQRVQTTITEIFGSKRKNVNVDPPSPENADNPPELKKLSVATPINSKGGTSKGTVEGGRSIHSEQL